MKKGKLSKIELSYIKNNSNLPVEQLAKDLGRSEALIKRVVATVEVAAPEMPPVEEPPAPTPPPKRSRIMDNIIVKDESTKKSKGVAVMTNAASTMADDTRSKRMSRRVSGATTKIYKD
jgi:hypothetical protein